MYIVHICYAIHCRSIFYVFQQNWYRNLYYIHTYVHQNLQLGEIQFDVCKCARILDSTNCQWTLKSSRHCCWTFTNLNMNILQEFLSVKYCISNRTKHMHALHTYYNVQRYSWVQLRHSFSCSPMKWCTNSFFFFFLSMFFILSNCWMLNSWYTFTLLCGPWYSSAHIYCICFNPT